MPEQPLALAGWARSQGVRAHALNCLGRHAAAQQICTDTLAQLTAADLELVAMSLNVQLELALAEAALGQGEQAAARLDALLRKLEPLEGPLTMSSLHEARAQVALLQGDQPGFQHHLACLEHWARRSSDRALITRAERVCRAGRPSLFPTGRASLPANDHDRAHDLTVLHRLRHGGARSLAGSAEWILDQLVEYADVRAGHVFVWRDGQATCVASYGELPEPAQLEPWLGARLRDEGERTLVEPPGAPGSDADRCVMGERGYRLLRLITGARFDFKLVGALVLPDDLPLALPARVLYAMGDRLQETLAEASVEPSVQATSVR